MNPRLRGGIGPLGPAPAHPYFRVPRGWLSAYAGGFIKSGLPSLGYGLLGNPDDLAGDEKIGIVHRVDQKNILHPDTVTFGDAGEGVAFADGVDDRIRLEQNLFVGGRYSQTGIGRLRSGQGGGGRGGRGGQIGEPIIKEQPGILPLVGAA